MGSKAPGCARSSPGREPQLRGTGSSQSHRLQEQAAPLGSGNRLLETFHKYSAAGGMLLTSGRSRPSSAELIIPHAVIAAGVGGINQVPSSNPLGKCYFQLILPKLDKCFTGCSHLAVCTKILNLAWKHKVKEKGVWELGRGLHITTNDQ